MAGIFFAKNKWATVALICFTPLLAYTTHAAFTGGLEIPSEEPGEPAEKSVPAAITMMVIWTVALAAVAAPFLAPPGSWWDWGYVKRHAPDGSYKVLGSEVEMSSAVQP